MFIDGAMTTTTGQAVTGGVVRDLDSNWILGFNYFLGNCNPLEAELWGIMDGVLIMLKNGYKKATIFDR